MYCSKCGAQLPDGSHFCSSCGATLSTNSGAPARKVPGSTYATASRPAYAAAGAAAVSPAFSHSAYQRPASARATYGNSASMASVQSRIAAFGIRNIISIVCALLAIVGFTMPWINVNTAATNTTNVVSNITSTILGTSNATAALSPTYSWFDLGSFGQGVDSYLALVSNKAGAYTALFSLLSTMAMVMVALLIIGALALALTKGRYTWVMRTTAIICIIAAIFVMMLLSEIPNGASPENSWYLIHSFVTPSTTGCILTVICCLVAAVIPQSVK